MNAFFSSSFRCLSFSFKLSRVLSVFLSSLCLFSLPQTSPFAWLLRLTFYRFFFLLCLIHLTSIWHPPKWYLLTEYPHCVTHQHTVYILLFSSTPLRYLLINYIVLDIVWFYRLKSKVHSYCRAIISEHFWYIQTCLTMPN